MSTMYSQSQSVFERRFPGVAVGIAGSVICLALALWHPHDFWPAYLIATLLVLGISLGCLALELVHQLTGGQWGWQIQRNMVAAAGSIPIAMLALLPLAVEAKELFPWLAPTNGVTILNRHQQIYFEYRWWIARASIYVVTWAALSLAVVRRYRDVGRYDDPNLLHQFRGQSAFGLVLLCLSIAFAAIDWVMSLEPRWNSTIYGATMLMAFAMSGLAFLLVARYALPGNESTLALQPDKLPIHSNAFDLGNLLLAFIMVWVYFSFSQFLIIWSGDLPRESAWYRHRMVSPWQTIGTALVIFHFAVPFACLLFRHIKRDRQRLAMVAAWILFMRVIDMAWTILPAREPLDGWWMACLPVALVTVASFWIVAFLQLRSRLPEGPFGVMILGGSVESIGQSAGGDR